MGGIAGNYGKTWNASRVGANAVGGGIASEVTGGRFKDGFKMAGLTSGMRYVYNNTVGFDIDARSGKGAVYKDGDGHPIQGRNNAGLFNKANRVNPVGSIVENPTFWQEGGTVSQWINNTPLGNAVLGLHDSIFTQQGLGLPFNNWINLPTVPLAIGVTGIGYLDHHYIKVSLLTDKSNSRYR